MGDYYRGYKGGYQEFLDYSSYSYKERCIGFRE